MSILSSMRYCLGPPDAYGNIWAALAFMPFGLFFDFMDGKVARWRHKSSLMGQELDSLADLVGYFFSPTLRCWPTSIMSKHCEFLSSSESESSYLSHLLQRCTFVNPADTFHLAFPQISFGVSPAVCAFALGLRTPLDSLLLSFFVLCGLTRLARFNVTVSSLPKDATGKSKYFEGTPIPTSLAIVAGMAWCVGNGRVGGEDVPGGLLRLGGGLLGGEQRREHGGEGERGKFHRYLKGVSPGLDAGGV